MGRKELFNTNKTYILKQFKKKPFYFSNVDISRIKDELKKKSLIPKNMSYDRFFNRLIDEGLNTFTLSIKGSYKTRYSFKKNLDHDLFASILSGKKTFLSMTTALRFQGFTDYRNDVIFISREQSDKGYYDHENVLKQAAVDKAFRQSTPRYSNSIGELDGKSYVFLSPKYSDCYEVITMKNGVKVSSINRSFVEMIINIHYFKTYTTIINIFRPLKEKLDVKKIYTFIKILNYIYPYFQCAGFYLEQIGFRKDELIEFKNNISDLNFYTQKSKLEIVGEDYLFNEYWKMYY